ncbi:hypothetical protein BH10CHL1_BH10CHL1_20880 [soil metagenome]
MQPLPFSLHCLARSRQSGSRRILLFVSLFLVVSMVAACGRSREPEGLPTEIPTLVVQPTATAEPTATTAPAATDTPVAATATEVSTGTVVSTDTVDMTTTTTVTETTSVTTTTAPTTTAPVTGTATVTATTPLTQTVPITTTPVVTATSSLSTSVTPTSTTPITGATTLTATSAATGTTTAQRVFFREPTNGATIPVTTTVVMGAEGLKVEPAGAVEAGAGHFHILEDTDFIPAGEVIPNDATHLHFGKAQLTTPITLTPGIHVLHLQFANGEHIALDGPQYRDTITVTVVAGAPAQSVHFVTPLNDATVPEKFAVTMAATGLLVEPAGEPQANAGHFHILVDQDFVPAGEVITKDAEHLHYGLGQTQATLDLKPGKHTLRLQFANGTHIALDGPQYRDEITVTVK